MSYPPPRPPLPPLADSALTVIGVGNEWRGDDAAGLLVARALQAAQLPRVQVFEVRGTMSDVREAWKDATGVILVDAVAAAGPPGLIHRFDAHAAGLVLPVSRSASSHGWGVAEALALGRVFRELPPYLIIYGIVGKNFDPGQNLSPEVTAAIPEAARRIEQEIQAWLERKGVKEQP